MARGDNADLLIFWRVILRRESSSFSMKFTEKGLVSIVNFAVIFLESAIQTGENSCNVMLCVLR